MGLMPTYYTTTSFKKRKVKQMTKSKAAALVEYNRERKRSGLAPIDTMIAPKRSRSLSVIKTPTVRSGVYIDPSRSTKNIPSLMSSDGDTFKPKPKEYTGSAMIGISTMHKSNAIPVFSQDHAKDISKMRRG